MSKLRLIGRSGHSKIYYDYEWQEYIVKTPEKDSSYHTACKEDAHDTAFIMSKEYERNTVDSCGNESLMTVISI
jgi:hypothetical protein